jgi:hypothetical protein
MKLLAGKRQGNRHKEKPSSSDGAIVLDAYEPERQEIARQILTSCDAMHGYYDRLIAMSAEGKPLSESPEDPTRKVTSGSTLDLALFQSAKSMGRHGVPAR